MEQKNVSDHLWFDEANSEEKRFFSEWQQLLQNYSMQNVHGRTDKCISKFEFSFLLSVAGFSLNDKIGFRRAKLF